MPKYTTGTLEPEAKRPNPASLNEAKIKAYVEAEGGTYEALNPFNFHGPAMALTEEERETLAQNGHDPENDYPTITDARSAARELQPDSLERVRILNENPPTKEALARTAKLDAEERRKDVKASMATMARIVRDHADKLKVDANFVEKANWLDSKLNEEGLSLEDFGGPAWAIRSFERLKAEAKGKGEESAGDAEAMDEPDALPDELSPVPPYSPGLSPEPFKGYIQEQATLLDCPPEFISTALLCSLGSVLGNKRALRPKEHDSWSVYPNVWGAIVGLPAAMKTPAANKGLAPLHHLQREADAKHAEAMRDADKRAFIDKIRRANAETEVKKALKAGLEPDLSFMDGDEAEAQERVFATNNTTLEALHELLATPPNTHGVLVENDELAALLGKMKEPGKGEEMRAFYLKGWNGNQRDHLRRIGRGTVTVERVCLSVFGGIQPGKLAPIVDAAMKQTEGDDGFIQRFGLMVWPDLKPDWKFNDTPTDRANLERVLKVFEHAEKLEPTETPWRFTGEARESFKEWLEEWVADSKNEPEAIQSHFGKYRSLVPQLALLIHFSEAEEPEAESVGTVSLAKAILWAEFLASHARRIYHGGNQNRASTAKRLLAKIREGKVALEEDGGFSARSISRKGWAGLKDRAAMEAALAMLEDYGWLNSEDVPSGPKGGRPKTIYYPHPATMKKSEK